MDKGGYQIIDLKGIQVEYEDGDIPVDGIYDKFINCKKPIFITNFTYVGTVTLRNGVYLDTYRIDKDKTIVCVVQYWYTNTDGKDNIEQINITITPDGLVVITESV